MKKIVIVSGYFNPLHIGHTNLIREAKAMGDFLVVILNNDEQVKIKGSTFFMPQDERVEILNSIKYVDEVFLSVDKDISVRESLKSLAQKYNDAELFFANGGDRCTQNIPETDVCNKYNIKIIDGVGGQKVQSSSNLILNATIEKIKKISS